VEGLEIVGDFGSVEESCGLDNVAWLTPCAEEAPVLRIGWQVDPAGVVLEWPVNAFCYQLEMTESLSAPHWRSDLSILQPILTNEMQRVTVGWSGGNLFFRLRRGDAVSGPEEEGPRLSLRRLSGREAVLEWPVSGAGWQLECAETLTAGSWGTNLPAPVVVGGLTHQVTVELTSTSRFFRLRLP
jgi:hypothetical protein